jgi:HlyD family secretion protein
VDSFPGNDFRARVRRVASDAEFTPRNVQTTEKRAELVFEMKVDLLEKHQGLRAGMYADVTVPLKGAR